MQALRASIPLTALLALATPVHAQDACTTAACHVERGLAARTSGDDAAAVEHFEAALALERTPRTLAQLALAEQALGRWIDAEAHLGEAMAAANDPWITDHRTVLEGALGTIREHLGRLVVTSNVDGARLRINGRDAGRLPLAGPVSVEVGTAVVDVTADGHVPVQRQEQISPGGLARIRVDLVPRAGTVADAVVEDPRPLDPITLPVERDPPPAPYRGPSAFEILGGVAAGLTAVALGMTIAALAVREDHVLAWNDPVRCPPFPDGRLVACPDEHATFRTAEDLAIAGAITSGVLAALTVVFFAVGAGQPDDTSDVGFDLELGPDRALLGARARF